MLITRMLAPLAAMLALALVLVACGRQPAAEAPADRPAPELVGGGAWLNGGPTSLAELRGKVVLVNFWTLGCINCKNTLPAVRSWWERYRDRGLVIIGVHTPEFAYEADLANVREAADRLGVTWPVVQDNDMQIWRAYKNNYWPRFYLVDKSGSIVYDHIGEGAYDEMDRQIEAALDAS